jgi:hypothetical protein
MGGKYLQDAATMHGCAHLALAEPLPAPLQSTDTLIGLAGALAVLLTRHGSRAQLEALRALVSLFLFL